MAFHGKPGDRVRLVFTPNNPAPVPEGMLGTVKEVVDVPWGQDKLSQVLVAWDNDCKFSCVCPPNYLEVVQ
jgi:hypothetical protein